MTRPAIDLRRRRCYTPPSTTVQTLMLLLQLLQRLVDRTMDVCIIASLFILYRRPWSNERGTADIRRAPADPVLSPCILLSPVNNTHSRDYCMLPVVFRRHQCSVRHTSDVHQFAL